MSKKILVFYTSIGLGHKSIAENIGYHLEQSGYKVKLFDVLQLQAGALVSLSTFAHYVINKYFPFVWKWLYVHADHGWFANLTLSKRVKVASRNYYHVKKVIDEFQPDLVIATQTNASAIIQYLKQQGWYKNLFAIAFSDYHLHRYWLYDAADFYLVNIEEQKQEMVRLGIGADKIYVLGMTLRPQAEVDTAAVRQKLGLKPGEPVVLIASGSLGIGLPAQRLAKLAAGVSSDLKARPIIVCGKNTKLYEQLSHTLKNINAVVVGYYKPLAELYAISDIFLTKPGGLTIAEALQAHLPILITHWLPGQEEINYHYLLSKKLIMPQPSNVEPSQLLPVISAELRTHSFKQSLSSNPALVQLTRVGQEGQALTEAIKQRFHEV
jgi:processive 1,2-diacylglycerol beta-glucosyltransferase